MSLISKLLKAAETNDHELVERLLKGASLSDIQAVDESGGALHRAAEDGHVDLCRSLLFHKANVDQPDHGGRFALHHAAEYGNADMCQILLDHKANVNCLDKDGWTALHWAVREGCDDVCKMLLDHKANVNRQDANGWSALHEAATEGDADICKMLLDHQANVNCQDQDGCTALHIADVRVCKLLLDHNANPCLQDEDGFAALHYAAGYNRMCNLEACELLVRYKAHVNAQAKSKATALHYAALECNVEVCRFLLQHKADINLQDEDLDTPLHGAASYGEDAESLRAVEFLLTYQPNLHVKNKTGQTALDFAQGTAAGRCLQAALDKERLQPVPPQPKPPQQNEQKKQAKQRKAKGKVKVKVAKLKKRPAVAANTHQAGEWCRMVGDFMDKLSPEGNLGARFIQFDVDGKVLFELKQDLAASLEPKMLQLKRKALPGEDLPPKRPANDAAVENKIAGGEAEASPILREQPAPKAVPEADAMLANDKASHTELAGRFGLLGDGAFWALPPRDALAYLEEALAQSAEGSTLVKLTAKGTLLEIHHRRHHAR